MLRMPAPWEHHAACWVAWPCRLSIWPDYAASCQAYANVINTIANYEPVNLLVPANLIDQARKMCRHDNVTFITQALDDSWARDTMPVFVVNNEQLGLVNWKFNAWGNKFSPYQQDAALGDHVIAYFQRRQKIAAFHPELILEGGAIHSNGEGLLITTKSSVLAANRNPGATSEKMEQAFKQYLGITHCVWLDDGLLEDFDTDGHIDNVATFTSPTKIVMQAFDQDDMNYNNFQKNKSQLENSVKGLEVVTVRQPEPVIVSGKRLALSYINFYTANHAIILPMFNQPLRDTAAKETLQSLYPGYDIVPIPSLDLLIGGGGIHCMTYEEPSL